MINLYWFLLSHRDFMLWDITQKAHISGLQILEISEIWDIFDNEAVNLCLMGADQFFSFWVPFSTYLLSQKTFKVSIHIYGTYILVNIIGNVGFLAIFWKFLIFRRPKYVPYVCHTTFIFRLWDNYTSEVYMTQVSAS